MEKIFVELTKKLGGLDATPPEEYMKAAHIYMLPKMQKTPTGWRFVAASHDCITKPLSQMVSTH